MYRLAASVARYSVVYVLVVVLLTVLVGSATTNSVRVARIRSVLNKPKIDVSHTVVLKNRNKYFANKPLDRKSLIRRALADAQDAQDEESSNGGAVQDENSVPLSDQATSDIIKGGDHIAPPSKSHRASEEGDHDSSSNNEDSDGAHDDDDDDAALKLASSKSESTRDPGDPNGFLKKMIGQETKHILVEAGVARIEAKDREEEAKRRQRRYRIRLAEAWRKASKVEKNDW